VTPMQWNGCAAFAGATGFSAVLFLDGFFTGRSGARMALG
jgi:hypothetical protein